MKKTLITLAVALTGYCSFAQTFNPTNSINAANSVNSLTGGYTFAYATSGSPWNGALMSFGGFSNNYDCQISTDYGPNYGNHISFRTHNGDANTWNPWHEMWHSGNLNNSSTDFTAKSIYANGNVGIGTTSPSAPLDVEPSINSSWATQIINNGTTDAHGLYVKIGSGSTGIPFRVDVSGSDMFQVSNNGNVLIGRTSQVNTAYKLDINGSARANEVVVNTTGADFVFDNKYSLPKLPEVESYINDNHHLPEIPSAEQMKKDGLSVGEMNTKLLQKVEELTLYAIDQQKQIEELKQEQQQKSEQQEARIEALEKALSKK